MNEISFKEKQVLSFEILKNIDMFCAKNCITYYIAYGTLLGAVRHSGFIPWDDDIDIIMFRKDYNKFINLFNANHKHSNLLCLSFEQDTFYLPYSKVVDTNTSIRAKNFIQLENSGIAVDVFPFDNSGDSIYEVNKNKSLVKLNTKLLRYSLFNAYTELSNGKLYTCYKLFPFLLSKLLGYKFLRKKLRDQICYISNHNERRHLSDAYVLSYGAVMCGDHGYYKDSWFGKPCKLEFNGYKFPAPNNYEAFLENRYGNYMQLPPESERIPHYGKAFYK